MKRKLEGMQTSLLAEKSYGFDDPVNKWLSVQDMLHLLALVKQQSLLWQKLPMGNAAAICTVEITFQKLQELPWDRADIYFDYEGQHYSVIRYNATEQASIMEFIQRKLSSAIH